MFLTQFFRCLYQLIKDVYKLFIAHFVTDKKIYSFCSRISCLRERYDYVIYQCTPSRYSVDVSVLFYFQGTIASELFFYSDIKPCISRCQQHQIYLLYPACVLFIGKLHEILTLRVTPSKKVSHLIIQLTLSLNTYDYKKTPQGI